VENRPGAGSIIGAGYVAKAEPDGYTLLLMEPGAVVAKWLSKNVPFDVVADFTPIAMVAAAPVVLFANGTVPFHDIKGMIAYAHANPGKLSAGTPGIASPHHMAAAWLNTAAKIQITPVAYRGAGPGLNDLLGGQIPLLWATPVAVLPFVAQGKVQALAVSTAQRDRALPQVPTIAESVVPGFDVNAWLGVAAPAKVPADIVARLAQAIRKIVGLPDVQKRLAALGLNDDFRDSDQFRALVAADHAKYGTIAHDAGIVPS
jgi:tripartite-type tricarboxylate transporter receptor subunit TctC